ILRRSSTIMPDSIPTLKRSGYRDRIRSGFRPGSFYLLSPTSDAMYAGGNEYSDTHNLEVIGFSSNFAPI
ncbi:MAG: hypothetical protein LBM08_10160, partial [Dysgonamonadaceae bacterium]|nr:hypothetical protein [Dysgonamonadaceae bacterium]